MTDQNLEKKIIRATKEEQKTDVAKVEGKGGKKTLIPIIPNEEVTYRPPRERGYPADAERYLIALAQTGTISTATAIAGVGADRVAKWRKALKKFDVEEDNARSYIIDHAEYELIASAMGQREDMKGMPRFKSLEAFLKARNKKDYGAVQNKVDTNNTTNVNITWMDIMKQGQKEINGKVIEVKGDRKTSAEKGTPLKLEQTSERCTNKLSEA